MPDPLFTGMPHLLAFYAAIGTSAVSEFLGRRQYDAPESRRADAGSFRVLQVAVFVGLLVGLYAAFAVDATAIGPERVAFWAGLVLVLAGVAIRRVAMATLDEHFSYHVAVREGHEVVDDGPYAWVRHPSYTGGSLSYLGIGLALGNWIAVAALVGACAVGYGYRIRVEERVLRDELGEAYREYAERTPYRLVPGVW